MRILIVEDNEMNRDMLSRRLLRKGFDVDTAEDGLVALNCLSEKAFDLVLMDIRLPLLNGLDVIRHIRASSSLKELPVIALTANATLTDQEKAYEAGCDDFEIKPVEFSRLLEKIHKFDTRTNAETA